MIFVDGIVKVRFCGKVVIQLRAVCCYAEPIPRNPWFYAVFRPFCIYTKCRKCTGKGVKKRNSSKCWNRTGSGGYVKKWLIYGKNRTFGCKRLKVLFLYHFLDGKALKTASIRQKICEVFWSTCLWYFLKQS